MLKILLIDDNPDDRILARREMEKQFLDMELVQIIDQADFDLALQQGGIDLVITDYEIRWTNGLEVLAAVKAHYLECPVIMFTGTGTEEVAVEAMKKGLDDYIVKTPRHYSRLPIAANFALEKAQHRHALRHAEQRVKAERALLEAVIQQLPEGIIIAEAPTSKWIMVNKQLDQLLGQTVSLADSIEQYASYQLCHLDETVYQPSAWPIARSILQGESVIEEEASYRMADGTYRVVSLSSVPIRDIDGTVVAAVMTWHDLTEHKRIEAASQQLLQLERDARIKAEESDRIKNEFIASISHELRTPLQAIIGWGQLMLSGNLNNAGVERAVDAIFRNAKAQSQLIEDLLDFSRIMNGSMRLNMELCNLDAIVKAALDSITPAAIAKQLKIVTSLNGQVAQIYADPGRMQQVCWNLLANAVKFTPAGGQIEVRLEQQQEQQIDTVIFTVSDNGKGITADFLPYVFSVFRQAEGGTTRKYAGLGLGLSIVKTLVEMQGGTVTAASAGEGKGATFTVILPVLKSIEQSNPAVAVKGIELSGPVTEQLVLKDLRILLVEDNQDTRELLQFILERQGAQVTTEITAGAALHRLLTTNPDLLISDIGLPDEDGYQLIRKIRALNSGLARIPAIALTAYNRVEDQKQAIEAGFRTHLAKPVDATVLIEKINKLINLR